MRRSYSSIYKGSEEDLGQYGEYFWVENNGKYSANIYVIQSGYSSDTITVEYSYDMQKWTSLKASLMLDSYFTLAIGERAYIRGNNKTFNSSGYTYEWNGFTSNRSTNVLHIGGNIMSLFYGDKFKTATAFDSSVKAHCMGMFVGFVGLTDASQLVLPVKDISTVSTYGYMFQDCAQLVLPPVLDLETPNNGSICQYMFYNCKALTETPDLKITKMNYYYGVYAYMFYYCSSLESIVIPESVTSIDSYAFYGCSSLMSITIPESVTIRMASWDSYNGNYEMFKGIASKGTIYMPSNATWSPSSYGVPAEWTVSKTL